MYFTAQVQQVRLPFMEEVGLATTVCDCFLLLSSSARRTQERIAELQYELEASRDREVAAHDQLSRLTVQVCVGGRRECGGSVGGGGGKCCHWCVSFSPRLKKHGQNEMLLQEL